MLKNLILNLLTPSTDSIIRSFTRKHAQLMRRAALHDDAGQRFVDQAERAERLATEQFAASERAERIAEKFKQFAA